MKNCDMQTLTDNTLNVTLLEPRQRHPEVFCRFDKLEEGETLTIMNDHDPKPLYYQLLGRNGNIFDWEYLEQGPVFWTVNITRRIAAEQNESIGQIAAADLRKAEVFKRNGLDFCCGGKKTLHEACAEKGIDVVRVEQELQKAGKDAGTRPFPYIEWSLGFLADYIERTHHSYVLRVLPNLVTYSEKVVKAHHDRHPELVQINNLILGIDKEMRSHMIKEEMVVFPFIREIESNRSDPFHGDDVPDIHSPIRMMEMEHEVVGKSLEEIRKLSGNFTVPTDACATYNVLYRMLEEFEDDLHMHVHLENNILFPGALKLISK